MINEKRGRQMKVRINGTEEVNLRKGDDFTGTRH